MFIQLKSNDDLLDQLDEYNQVSYVDLVRDAFDLDLNDLHKEHDQNEISEIINNAYEALKNDAYYMIIEVVRKSGLKTYMAYDLCDYNFARNISDAYKNNVTKEDVYHEQ